MALSAKQRAALKKAQQASARKRRKGKRPSLGEIGKSIVDTNINPAKETTSSVNKGVRLSTSTLAKPVAGKAVPKKRANKRLGAADAVDDIGKDVAKNVARKRKPKRAAPRKVVDSRARKKAPRKASKAVQRHRRNVRR